MRVQKYVNQFAEQPVIRVLQTTCPLCHKAVQFAMQDSDFVAEETETLEEENMKLRESLAKQERIIHHLSCALEMKHA